MHHQLPWFSGPSALDWKHTNGLPASGTCRQQTGGLLRPLSSREPTPLNKYTSLHSLSVLSPWRILTNAGGFGNLRPRSWSVHREVTRTRWQQHRAWRLKPTPLLPQESFYVSWRWRRNKGTQAPHSSHAVRKAARARRPSTGRVESTSPHCIPSLKSSFWKGASTEAPRP